MTVQFTERARLAGTYAAEEVKDFGHERTGLEHLLIGLLRAEGGIAAEALNTLGLTAEAVREGVKASVGRRIAPTDRQIIRYTAQADRLFERSAEQAKMLESSYVDTEHILLAILDIVRKEGGVVAQILAGAGIDQDELRRKITEVTGLTRPAVTK